MKKRIISILLALSVLCSALTGVMLTASATGKDVKIKKEEVLYEWDLTDYKTFWSVAGESSNPLDKAAGSNDKCDFKVDGDGAYMKPKADWVAFNTTGACNNVDLTDVENTKLVIDYETPVQTTVIVKLDMTKGGGDNYVECFFQSRTGSGTLEFSIKDLRDNKFKDQGIDVKEGYTAIQLMTTKGSDKAAVLWKSARIVKTVEETVSLEQGKNSQALKNYELANGTSKGVDIESIHNEAMPQYKDGEITMNATAQWVGFTSTGSAIDISDPTTRLVAEIDNPEKCTIAYKFEGDGISSRSQNKISKELSLNSDDGVFEIYFNQIFTLQQMKALSAGKIKLQILLGSTNKPVTIKALSIVKDASDEPQANEAFKSYEPVDIVAATGSDPVLPETIRVKTEKNRTVDIKVSFTKPDLFNNQIPGTYKFVGTLDEESLKANFVLYDPEKNEPITASVTLKASYDRYELPVTNSANWSKSGTDVYGSYIFDSNGLSVTPTGYLGYTNSNYTVKDVNLDVVKGISYNITVDGAKWAIKVKNSTTGDPQISSGELQTSGEGFYDFSDCGWTGTADLIISLFAVGADKTATYHSVVLDKKPVAKESFNIDTTNNKGWIAGGSAAQISGENDAMGYAFSDKGLTLTSKGAYCAMNYVVTTVNLDVVKGLLYYIEAPNSRWEIKVKNLKTGEQTQIATGSNAWMGTLGTALSYFDFSSMGWSGTADLDISVFVIVSGSDNNCLFKSLQLLPSKPEPMPEIPKEPAKTELSLDLTDYKNWTMGGKKLESAANETADYKYSFSQDGFNLKSMKDENGVFWSSISTTATNIDLSALRYLYYNVSTPSAERWDVKIYNLSQFDDKGSSLSTTISGSWNGIGGSDEGYFALPKEWIGACNLKIELYAFSSKEYTGEVNFKTLDFKTERPSSPDSVTIDFSDYKAFSLSGGAIASDSKFETKFGSYEFVKSGLTMSANRVKANDGSTQFWLDAGIKLKNIDFSKTDTLEFDVGLTKGSWTIQVTNNSTGETINYAKVVKPSDQAWSGVEVPKNSIFNIVKAAKDQLGATWSGTADISIRFQALNTGKESNVTFRSCKLLKGPSTQPTVTSYNFDFSKYEGWVLENEGLITKPKGVSSNKIATYNFAASGLTLKTERHDIDGANVFYSKMKYSIDYVDFDKLNALTLDVTATDDAKWDVIVYCSTADNEHNKMAVSGGKWDGFSGNATGTMSFKEMGWTGIGTITVQIVGLDFGKGNEIFIKSMSLGTGETTIKQAGKSYGSAEELEYATIKCPSLKNIEDILNDKNRFSAAVSAENGFNLKWVWIVSAAVLLIAGASVTTVVLIKKKKAEK